MFYLIRILLGCIIGCCLASLLKKLINTRRLIMGVFVFFMVILTIVSMFIPFENLFITFDSPEKAFRYNDLYRTDTCLVINGGRSDLIVGDKDNTDILLIIPKDSAGWKVGLGQDTKRIGEYLSEGIVINVYRYKNTDDYYLSVLDTRGGEAIITDSCGSKFLQLSCYNDSTEKTYVTYYAYIPQYDSAYSLNVNGIAVFP